MAQLLCSRFHVDEGPIVLSSVLAFALAACTSNVDSGSETGSGSGTSGGSPTTEGTSGTGSTSSGASESVGSNTDTTAATETSSSGSSTGGESVEQQICESQGGVWDELACGHYQCGVPQACEAIIPGCDCGPFATFTKTGCTVLAECSVEFACGDELTCLAAGQYCDVFVPGVKGPPIVYTCADTPMACLGDYTCDCLAAQGIEGDCQAATDGSLTITLYAA